jgi:hypothetical protein
MAALKVGKPLQIDERAVACQPVEGLIKQTGIVAPK